MTTGGPSDATIEYLLGDKTIGSVTGDGVVTGDTLGSTSLTGRAVGLDKSGTFRLINILVLDLYK